MLREKCDRAQIASINLAAIMNGVTRTEKGIYDCVMGILALALYAERCILKLRPHKPCRSETELYKIHDSCNVAM